MPAAITLCATLVLSVLIAAHGHGRLTKPIPRNGGANPSGTENAPATINDASATNFVCRHSARNTQVPLTDVTAGGTLTLQWTTPAAHVGDCAIYITYDVDQDLVNQRYFKIANLPDCKSQQNTDVTITIPDFLPAGQAIMRWDWYALHVRPQIEFYVQCVDIQVTGSSNSVFASQISAYTITNPPIYPSTGNEGVGFRNAFNPGSEQYMTGPACANGITINNCPLTAVGTTGNTRDGGVIGGPGPSPTPTVAPSPAPSPSPTPSPAPSPNPNNGNCESHQIVAGDTLTKIATLFTNAGKVVTAQQICDFNGLSDCNLIFVGEFLVIPYAGSLCGASTSSSSTTTTEITTTSTSSSTTTTTEITTTTTATTVTTTDKSANPATTNTVTTDITTTTIVALVRGSLVLNVSNTQFFSGDALLIEEIKTALATAIAEFAGVDISAVVVTLTEPRRLQSGTEAFSTVTAEYTITVLANEAAAVVQRIVSTEPSLATTVVAQRLSDADFDGVVRVISFSANIVANDSSADEAIDASLIAMLIGGGIGAVGVLLLLLCCWCSCHCCCPGCCTAKKQEKSSLPV